jgi:thiamine biosynthesis protein ThiS
MTVQIVVNGEPRTAPQGQTILGLLRELEIDPARVAVELDRQIVKQAQWEDTTLAPGSRLEIVQFVGGG